MFTRNQIVGAPVILGREHLRRSRGNIHALIVNAGNANCATGKHGIQAANAVCSATAKALGFHSSQVFPSSTGIIGVPLPFEKIVAAVPGLVASARGSLSTIASANANPGALDEFAAAIMTTDTRKKIAAAELVFKKRPVRLVGVAKGAGMIHPNMATMLVYLFTDIVATPRELQSCLKTAVDQSFNNISIDGDTSTNDTTLLLASGKSGVQLKSARKHFEEALTNVCRSLAKQIVSDGEGVKHVVRLIIEQARSTDDARKIARAIANSPLVKTAWAGCDPNWGRMLAAIGYSGVKIDPSRISIYLGKQRICHQGAAAEFDKARAHEYMKQPEYDIRFSLGSGKSRLDFLSCDLTTEYIHINADYST